MNPPSRHLLPVILGLWLGFSVSAQTSPTPDVLLRKERRQFQDQELITARPFSFIFNVGDPPRIAWRDVETVQALGADPKLMVRWFDADLNEAAPPNHPGRWAAVMEGKSPNGTPLRRAITFYCRPPGFFLYLPGDLKLTLPHQPGPISKEMWDAHAAELSRLAGDAITRAVNDTETGAIVYSAFSEAKALDHPLATLDTALAANEAYHLKLRLKLSGLQAKVSPIAPPRLRSKPAPVLREGSLADAGMKPDAKEKLDALCREWAQDSGEPFVMLVARHGVIVTHEGFGGVETDYRCDVASITKSATAAVFSQFLDQGLIRLDDPVSSVLPDWPRDNPHVPTFRQCLTHMSGLTGHGDFSGVANPYLDNIVLNGIDVNTPGVKYDYAGAGFDLVAKAMELRCGKSWRQLYHDHLFEPLGIGDVPLGCASSGAQFTARELAILAQWFANGGSYGDKEFISPSTFAQMLPEDLSKRYPGVTTEIEGIGNHYMKPMRPTTQPSLILSERTIGHGSLTSCIFMIDIEHDLVITQVRKAAGPKYGEWSARFFQAIVDELL